MTTAPAPLKEARQILLDKLDMHPGVEFAPDLDPKEVGIVGDSSHVGGYHCGTDRCSVTDYSVRESPRDRAGFDLDASALDVGEFAYRAPDGRTWTLPDFSVWLVMQCRANTPDTRDIREVIYSPDGKVVRRWDRLGIRNSGDSSHLKHTHISFFRDSNGRTAPALARRFTTMIGASVTVADDVWGFRFRSPAGVEPAYDFSAQEFLVGANAAAYAAKEGIEAMRPVVDSIAVDVAAIKALLEDSEGSAELAPILAKLTAMEERLAELIIAPSSVSVTMSLSGSGSGSSTPSQPLPGA